MPKARHFDELPQDARQVLAELETLLDDDGLGHGTRDEPEFLSYRRRLLTCQPGDMAAITLEAARELQSCRRRAVPAIDRYDVRGVVLRECEGWAPTDVERSSHKAAARTVRKWRTDAGRDPETGKPIPGKAGSATDKVAALAAEGKSVRVIAMTVGLPKSTVHDMILTMERDAA